MIKQHKKPYYLLYTFKYKSFEGFLYDIKKPFALPKKLQNDLLKLCHIGFPGLEPEKTIQVFIGNQHNKILLMYTVDNQLAGATSVDILPPSAGLKKVMYISICIVSPQFQQHHIASYMIKKLKETYSPEIVALTAYHPALFSIVKNMKEYNVYPQFHKKAPDTVIQIAKKILAKRLKRNFFHHDMVEDDLVRRNLYPVNLGGNLFTWEGNKLAKSLLLKPRDGIFVVAIKKQISV